jgi:hypothetical protein
MIFIRNTIVCLIGIIAYESVMAGSGLPVLPKPEVRNVYVLSIGVDHYGDFIPKLSYCVSDAVAFAKKAKSDFDSTATKGESYTEILLLDEQATKENIYKALRLISEKAKVEDHFLFFHAGVTLEYFVTEETYLLPHGDFVQMVKPNKEKEETKQREIMNKYAIPLTELAEYLDKVVCENQLIISESGIGERFAENLLMELFSVRPSLVLLDKRNRVVLTTVSYGYEDIEYLGRQGGLLLTFILNNGYLDEVFSSGFRYRYGLYTHDLAAAFSGQYCEMYFEEDYRRFMRLAQRGSGQKYRGASVVNATETKETNGKTYGLFIGTNEYKKGTIWEQLQNPINDANAIASVFEKKYGVSVFKVYNKSVDEVSEAMDTILSKLGENDRLILFVAGHGYYSEKYKDGYMVFKDGDSPDANIRLSSYFAMASLNRLIDGLPTKNVFLIFDVCFGANFDIKGKDIARSNYEHMDIDLQTFDERKKEINSRLFMASGEYEVPDFWNNSLNHSPFAQKILLALEQEEEFITPSKIQGYMEGNATQTVFKSFGSHHPDGDFVLIKK